MSNPRYKLTGEQRKAMLDMYVNSDASAYRIGKTFGVSTVNVTATAKRKGVLRIRHEPPLFTKRCSVNDRFFDAIDTEHKAYWLGFIGADGGVYETNVVLGLAEKDGEHLELFCSEVESTYKIGRSLNRATSDPDGKQYVKVCTAIYSRHMAEVLRGYGIETGDARFSNGFPPMPEELFPHFCRGLFDGDGGFGQVRRGKNIGLRLFFTSLWPVTEQFKKALMENCHTGDAKLNKQGPGGKTACLHYKGNLQVGRIVEWLYRNATVWLPRKRILAEEVLNRPRLRAPRVFKC